MTFLKPHNFANLISGFLKMVNFEKKIMKQSNIQDRKLNIIEQLIILNDEDVYNKQVEELIDSALRRPHMKRFTKQELVNRAKIANTNIANGETYTHEEAEKLAQSW